MNITSLLSFAKAEVVDVISNPMKTTDKLETAAEFVMQSCTKMLKSDQAKMKELNKHLDASFAGFGKHLLG